MNDNANGNNTDPEIPDTLTSLNNLYRTSMQKKHLQILNKSNEGVTLAPNSEHLQGRNKNKTNRNKNKKGKLLVNKEEGMCHQGRAVECTEYARGGRKRR